MPPATGLAQTPATHVDVLSRTGSPQVPLQNAQTPTFHISQYLVLCLRKTGSALAVSKRYVIRKLQLSSVKTHQQDQQHILYHQGLDQLQQWTIPPKEIWTNLDTHLSQD